MNPLSHKYFVHKNNVKYFCSLIKNRIFCSCQYFCRKNYVKQQSEPSWEEGRTTTNLCRASERERVRFQLSKSVDCWELRDQHAEKSAYKTLSKLSSAESMTLEFFEIFSERENSMNCVLNLPVILVETCFYFKQESID